MAKKSEKKQLHERLKHTALKRLAITSVKQGYLISKEEAVKTKGFEESYLDDEVWTSSWDLIIKQLKGLFPETAALASKVTPKVIPKVTPKVAPKKGNLGGDNGKNI